ncbi:addiction module protein [Candidatus Sumerlaeota bacterium]|nr:addiction module protein [Candidatus Sumerlaeota bacterium]
MELVDIKRNISQLSGEERKNLTQWIITNLDEMDEGEDRIDAAWRCEVRKRIKEIKTGKVKMIPSDEMWKDLLSAYGKES